MLKDSTFFLLPQGNNKASTEQKLCNYKNSWTDNQDQDHKPEWLCGYRENSLALRRQLSTVLRRGRLKTKPMGVTGWWTAITK